MFMTLSVSAQNNDPTKPLSASGFSSISKAEASTKAELILESIIHGFEVHTAVINGQVLKIGDFIRQYELIAVNNTSVVLRSAEKRLKLSVFSRVVVKSK
ncbi:MAG: MSHA biogenesis protein MshK [Colwellia sp.]|jgi:MSHA biogenesis protein MshK